MKNLNIKQFKIDVSNFVVPDNDTYIKSYPSFIKYFENLDDITYDDFVISTHFVYGWMPTILNLDIGDKEKILELLNKVKNESYILSVDEVQFLRSAINNSVVGLSKLLHFINPNNYAIYDSRIYKYVRGSSTSSGIDRPERFIKYMNKIYELIQSDEFNELYEIINNQFEYHISKTRAIEVVLFETGKNS